jgi:3-dehydroquinate synthetase
VEEQLAAAVGTPTGTVLLRATTPIGRMLLGDGIAVGGVDEALRRLEAGRAILVSEPGAWEAVGARLASGLEAADWEVHRVMLPQGEDAKRLAVIEVGGGALGDSAGFLAATWLRGVPLVHVPTTLVAQIDSAIGGKTAVDLPEGKNLVGAFHQPTAIVIDVTALRTLPERQRRAALGEAVKMAVLGDDRLFELLESDGAAIARGESSTFDDGVVAELVERSAWAKVEVVMADERERAAGGRITLNLGHSLGHAIEAAAGYRGILHGEAISAGMMAAAEIGGRIGLTPSAVVDRQRALFDLYGLPLRHAGLDVAAVLAATLHDKKVAAKRIRWVLLEDVGRPVTRNDIPGDVVRDVLAAILA